MTANGALQTETISAIDEQALTGKLEFAILSVLIHYNGSYEESLVDWYSALRLGLPQLAAPGEVRDVFKQLSAGGIVTLSKPSGPSVCEGADDNRFFSRGPFVTAITAQGLVYWNTIRVQPWHSSTH